MGNWTNKPVVLPAIDFDGDKVVLTVKRLQVEDMQVLSKFYDRATGVLRFNDPLEVVAVAGTLFPKYIVGISGMTTADGDEVTVEDFIASCKEFYFVPLIGQLFSELVGCSTVRSKAKNSVPPTPSSSEALGGESLAPVEG